VYAGTLLHLRVHLFEELQEVWVVILHRQVGRLVIYLHTLVDPSFPYGLSTTLGVGIRSLQSTINRAGTPSR